MRTFAVLIMLLNLVYFIWNQIREDDAVVEVLPGQAFFMPAAQSLMLLAELPQAPSPLQREEEELVESADQVPASPDQNEETGAAGLANPGQNEISQAWCGVISGFEDQDEAIAFIAEISEMDMVASLDIQREQISSTWWVHLPPFPSQSEAQIVIDELVAKGIDNFYMRTGELAGGISLGVFSREPTAAIAQAELRGRGYDASIREIPRYVSKAYVTIGAADFPKLESPEWQAFFATKTKLEATEKLCETIAR